MKNILFTAILIFSFALVVMAQNEPKIIIKANEVLMKGDFRGAIAILDKGVAKGENLYEIYEMRSSLYGMTGNLQGEFDDLNKALEIKSTEGKLFERRARARMYLRQDNSLILADLDAAIANGHKIEKVYALRAIMRRGNNDFEGALADYQTALGLNPESASTNVGLSSTYELKGDEAQAISVLENFLSKYENSSKKLPKVKGEVVAQTDTLISKDEEKNIVIGSNSIVTREEVTNFTPTPEAMQKHAEKMEQAKNTSLAYANLARLYEKRGDYEKALETVGKSIKIDPSDANSFGVRGKIKSSMKDYEGALEDLNFAIKSLPSFPNYYADRGIVLLLMNKDAEAQKDFDKFLSIMSAPKSKTYLEKRIEAAKKLREENR